MTEIENPASAVKADRKTSAVEAVDESMYSVTDYGRKRRSRFPRFLAAVIALISVPFLFIRSNRRRLRAWMGGARASVRR
jgi:hypothetical protein